MRAVTPDAAVPRATLLTIAHRFGTPAYAYDLRRIKAQVRRIRSVLPERTDVLYSIKANPSLGVCQLLAAEGLGADTASVGELMIATAAGFRSDGIMVTGPHKPRELLATARAMPHALISVDSVDELHMMAAQRWPGRLLLRLRPDFDSGAAIYMGSSGRFGIPFDQLPEVRRCVARSSMRIAGFHVFSGSQILGGPAAAASLRGAFELATRAAAVLEVEAEVIGLGGGFGVPYGPGQPELDLAPVAKELARQRAVAPTVRLLIELGRYLTAPAGYYLTTVLGTQTRQSRPAVVVDGGQHQRPDLCGLDLARRAYPPVPLTRSAAWRCTATDVLGCLCLPADVLAEAVPLPQLTAGDVLAFANAGAYGLSAGANGFISHPVPPEIAFDGERVQLLRHRGAARAALRDQLSLFDHRNLA